MMDNAPISYKITEFIKNIDILNDEGSWEIAFDKTNANSFRSNCFQLL